MNTLTVLAPLPALARLNGRSYWALRYTDGRFVREDMIDWSLAPVQGRQQLRLYCPNGEVAELGNTLDATGRLFQLKVAVRGMGQGPQVLAHLIGIIIGSDGECRCAVWEPDPGHLIQFDDNVYAMQYQSIGALAFDPLGIRR